WAVKVINGMLRNAQRDKDILKEAISDSVSVQTSHPKWLVDALTTAWPESTAKILAANNEPGPMSLRVNPSHYTRDAYLAKLEAAQISAKASEVANSGIVLATPTDVSKLPDFAEGACSVQDEAAQLAAQLLDPQENDTILDACAAPGGKTTHLLEKQPKIKSLVALDSDADRLKRVSENLERLKLSAEVICEDLSHYCEQQVANSFDRILLDVPCSATGVIRRHPDIKWLRKRKDIPALALTQLQLLKACWPLLKPGGTLLYATCSVLPQENERVVGQFLKQEPSASEEILVFSANTLDAIGEIKTSIGRQLLPTVNGHDGFYYAKLRKAN
ncbi:MAG: 16S rRNA (cytosine(967)-C(5))-methyltransferase RsmB, partial [Pseudomonadales bacterium]|nr:16S rRNA (cytosine(967)-C(5))-methyltransferase RsmB [Pseudomonadales bacterium]